LRLDERPVCGPLEQRPDVDKRDERPAGNDDPVVELASMVVEPSKDAGRRGRQVGLEEPRLRALRRARFGGRHRGEVRRAPQLSERAARVGMARHGAEPDAPEG
jgi:hypothetical protein